ncbi:hypothetical protein Dsin_008293 [Dipteronia sinensis]|uniref:RNase H type-1 domain-containing protein n=1 Tax=Dipteronia sinensis TaxID=43782 RepID=A0AAE0ANW1_9ROSI|nr:hypothetical protein Dsin_008293 [Dipteronia sinensis]
MLFPPACIALVLDCISSSRLGFLLNGKKAWRVLSCPDSLASLVLKSKYFKNSDFLQATLKRGGSHLWRNILWGRSLLSKGLRWKVGDGSGIKVFDDPWIPRPSTFKPVTTCTRAGLRVSELINKDHHCWDLEKIDTLLIPLDKEAILSIPVSFRGGKDFLSWHFDKSGSFSVKSGYRLALKNALFWCSEAKKVWGLTRFDGFFDGFRALPAIDILSGLLSHVGRVDMADICVILWGIWENRNTVIAEISASTVASIINSSAPSLSDACFIVDDIRALCLEVGFCTGHAIPSSGNTLAHNLASTALSSVQECSWLDFSLPCYLPSVQ